MAYTDKEKYQWLIDNLGSWDVLANRPIARWTREDGTEYFTLARFSFRDTAYLGLDFDEAVECAMRSGIYTQTS